MIESAKHPIRRIEGDNAGRPQAAAPGAGPSEAAGRYRAESPNKRFRTGEREIAGEAIKDVNGNNFTKALADLDTWSQRYRESDYQDDRSYYYVLARNGAQQPGKVLEAAAPLVAKPEANSLDDPRQMILVLYLTSVNAQKLANPTREQSATARAAARGLLDSVPAYFTPENRPATTTTADWMKARTDLETAARTNAAGVRRAALNMHH